MTNASTVFVNGERVGKAGEVAMAEEKHLGSNVPYSVSFKPERNEIELLIQASSNRISGGIVKPIRFGTAEAIHFQTLLSVGLQLLLIVVLLLHSVYAFILYFMRSTLTKGLLYFTILLLCAIFTVLGSDDKLILYWVPIEYAWEVKLVYLAYIGVGACIPLVIDQLFTKFVSRKILRYFILYCFLYAWFILLSPPSYIYQTSKFLLLAVFVWSLFLSVINFRKANMDKEESIFLILGCLSIGTNIGWASVESNTSLEMIHYPFDLIITLLCFTAFWFKRFFHVTTGYKQLAEKLQAENKQKDEFLVNTSHELRNPLHGISNIIQTLLEDQTNPLNKEQQKRLSVMRNISQRMTSMLNDLMDVTRLNEKTIPMHLKKMHIQSVVSGVIDMTKLMLNGKPVQLLVKVPDNFPEVWADENRVIQILFNLVHNAIKFTDKGTITIYTTLKNGMAQIHIEDTGIGIPEEELSTIFEPYQQAAMSTHRSSGGFGLGLSICRQLVELQNGTLHVQSTPGKGTVFTFTLPLFNKMEQTANDPSWEETDEKIAATVESAHSADGDALKTTQNILTVDDDPVNLDILRVILEKADYKVTSVTSPSQAIAKLERESYDLVISDVMMPQISGYELTRVIRKRFSISELPVLLLTARTRPEDIVTGFKSGANDYVMKPIDSWELKARVKALTNLKASIEERIRIEGAWLQSQIQPHFIFNTLNSIAALGNVNRTKMQELLETFSHYLRLSFDFHNTDPVVPLEHELALVRSYLYIEKTRFGNRLLIKWDIDANIEVMIPPLSIQPLVENAVKHGILQQASGGTILIRITKHSDYIKISIRDNGKGMTESKMNQLFTEEDASERTSVGLQNVERRLKQFHGNGLTIQSKPNKGTTVSFTIPKQRDE